MQEDTHHNGSSRGNSDSRAPPPENSLLAARQLGCHAIPYAAGNLFLSAFKDGTHLKIPIVILLSVKHS
jgi:hypothetical protein